MKFRLYVTQFGKDVALYRQRTRQSPTGGERRGGVWCDGLCGFMSSLCSSQYAFAYCTHQADHKHHGSEQTWIHGYRPSNYVAQPWRQNQHQVRASHTQVRRQLQHLQRLASRWVRVFRSRGGATDRHKRKCNARGCCHASARLRCSAATQRGRRADIKAEAEAAAAAAVPRLLVHRLEKYLKKRQFVKHVLEAAGITYASVKKPPSTTATVAFASRDDLERARKLLDGMQFKGQTLVVETWEENTQRKREDVQQKRIAVMAAAQEPPQKRKKTEDGDASAANAADEEDQCSEAAPVGKIPAHVNEVVAPNYGTPYVDQLEVKGKAVGQTLLHVCQQIRKQCKGKLPAWITAPPPPPQKFHCPIAYDHKVVASPVTEGYRNKMNFSVGTDVQGKPCVGFQLGSTVEGVTVVGYSDDCPLVSERIRQLRSAFQALVERSGLPPWDKVTHYGFWRELHIRALQSGQTMVTVQVYCNEGDARLESVAQQLRECFLPLGVDSLQLQLHGGISNAADTDAALMQLHGPRAVRESLLGLSFNVSHESFLQVNSAGAALLYGAVRDLVHEAAPGGDALLLDVCCGVGGIGQVLAPLVKRVVGIEMVEKAVNDAKANAELNKLTNVSYIAGKAEDVLPATLRQFTAEFPTAPVIAIVDPPRCGLHSTVLKSLRCCERIGYIVYVSCNPKSLANDLIALCRSPSQNRRGTPFAPVRAVPVDMFPHTSHVELVVSLRRDTATPVPEKFRPRSQRCPATTVVTAETAQDALAPPADTGLGQEMACASGEKVHTE
eukprot:TRINITY_DN1689_c0_g1_i1.p1 TRINITY_DN1689_c0_g1~~TRINITY_DN1689_c0_g1_i1.p1  ORF type:complete len:783 (-),score=176.93 TRINITY_DN1689_c0_g1_i1:1241-3589(-)